MTRVVIVSSGEGYDVESVVSAVRRGAVAAGSDIRLRSLADIDSPLDEVFEAMVWADGIVLVAATRDGVVAPPVQHLVHSVARRRERLGLPDKVVAVHAVGHDRRHHARIGPELHRTLFSWDCLLVPSPGETTSTGGTGTGSAEGWVSAEDLGRRLARIARSLRGGVTGPALRRAG